MRHAFRSLPILAPKARACVPTPARGVVLVAVLWIISALSIIVAGLSESVREEARSMGQLRQRVVARAQGDAAIFLALQELLVRTAPTNLTMQFNVSYQGVSIPVEIMPLNGLIDINSAPLPLLAALYSVAGGLAENDAQALAQATFEYRSKPTDRGPAELFEAPEDLLRVPGVTYPLYARLSGLITTDLRGSGRVNPLAAPRDVLLVLAKGDAARADAIANSRQSGAVGIDTTALEGNFMDQSSVRRFRVQAWVSLPDGARVRVTRSVDMTLRGRDGLPWRTFHTESGTEPVNRKNS